MPLKIKLSKGKVEKVDALLMDGSTPAALSIGRRCMDDGYTFIWKPFENPRLLDPRGYDVPLIVENYCPYLRNSSTSAMAAVKARVPHRTNESPVVGQQDEAPERRDLKAEALSVEHQMCHFPKNIYCSTCRRAKMMQKPARKSHRAPDKRPTKFGELVTADQIICGSDLDKGIRGETCLLVILDVATDWLECYPLKTKHADSIYESLYKFEGKERVVMRFYSDRAPELIKAAQQMGWLHDKSVPGVHESNAIAESAVRRVLNGTRAVLEAAGFEPEWWPYAARTFCFLHNTALRDGESPWNLRHKKWALQRYQNAIW